MLLPDSENTSLNQFPLYWIKFLYFFNSGASKIKLHNLSSLFVSLVLAAKLNSVTWIILVKSIFSFDEVIVVILSALPWNLLPLATILIFKKLPTVISESCISIVVRAL
ncbi:hypothetical protein [Spiroplasma ixodetis]|uniref:Uncharacterized protein n=1 Tax=Spiroplasma ixodetis TaxID=2141 RepID=A0ABM8JUN7_9MOLU